MWRNGLQSCTEYGKRLPTIENELNWLIIRVVENSTRNAIPQHLHTRAMPTCRLNAQKHVRKNAEIILIRKYADKMRESVYAYMSVTAGGKGAPSTEGSGWELVPAWPPHPYPCFPIHLWPGWTGHWRSKNQAGVTELHTSVTPNFECNKYVAQSALWHSHYPKNTIPTAREERKQKTKKRKSLEDSAKVCPWPSGGKGAPSIRGSGWELVHVWPPHLYPCFPNHLRPGGIGHWRSKNQAGITDLHTLVMSHYAYISKVA